ncbi:MAG TPA: hypothetical protein VIF82_14810 [Burkholderiaceae bacterium]
MVKYILATALLCTNFGVHAIGFSMDIGNVFGQLATQSGTQVRGDSVDDVLQRLSAQLNQKMPVTVDSNTRLERVSAEPGRHFTYHYTLVAAPSAGNTPIDFSKEIKPQLKSQLCGSTENQKFLKNGVTISYEYQDQGGRDIGGAEFTPTDCGFRS